MSGLSHHNHKESDSSSQDDSSQSTNPDQLDMDKIKARKRQRDASPKEFNESKKKRSSPLVELTRIATPHAIKRADISIYDISLSLDEDSGVVNNNDPIRMRQTMEEKTEHISAYDEDTDVDVEDMVVDEANVCDVISNGSSPRYVITDDITDNKPEVMESEEASSAATEKEQTATPSSDSNHTRADDDESVVVVTVIENLPSPGEKKLESSDIVKTADKADESPVVEPVLSDADKEGKLVQDEIAKPMDKVLPPNAPATEVAQASKPKTSDVLVGKDVINEDEASKEQFSGSVLEESQPKDIAIKPTSASEDSPMDGSQTG